MVQVTFKSAENIANEMGRASESLQQSMVQEVAKATKTTVTINEKSQDSHETLMELSKEFSRTFNKTIEQINTVTKEFERTDVELQSNINELFPLNNLD